MTDDDQIVEANRQMLVEAQQRGRGPTLLAYFKLSGPGWLQSAITLGGGSLASSLYLGVLAGVSMMWVQPLAMILGIIMLSAIAYITTSTGERPFRAINEHVNPVLGWSWALASLAANMVWCLPQFSLANAVLAQNLMPEVLGPDGSLGQWAAATYGTESWLAANAGKLAVSVTILILTVAITWAYDGGSWGIRLYEWALKLMVAMIVLCFFGVVVKLSLTDSGLAWGEVLRGFVPDWRAFTEPSTSFAPLLDAVSEENRAFWSKTIVDQQRDVMISAAATAVGINMTFLFPYSILRKRWTREYRGLAVFDLATGMFIPFVLATSCVIIAAATQFHARPVPGFFDERNGAGEIVVPDRNARSNYVALLTPRLKRELGDDDFKALASGEGEFAQFAAAAGPATIDQLSAETVIQIKADFGTLAVEQRLEELPEADRRLAAVLVNRDSFDLAKSLKALFADEEGKGGDFYANGIFSLGVLGMTLSTITLLMLISGFVICEIFGLPQGGWPHRLGCLAACTGALGPFIWGRASFYLAVPTSVFGMVLLPFAYLSFFLLMNQRSLMGEELPRGFRRVLWNLLMAVAAGVAISASGWIIWTKSGVWGAAAVALLLLLALIVQIRRATVR
jgi:Mn2+/Fe2+ NRAMP family transporter